MLAMIYFFFFFLNTLRTLVPFVGPGAPPGNLGGFREQGQLIALPRNAIYTNSGMDTGRWLAEIMKEI